jgi:hypothetical protein
MGPFSPVSGFLMNAAGSFAEEAKIEIILGAENEMIFFLQMRKVPKEHGNPALMYFSLRKRQFNGFGFLSLGIWERTIEVYF